MAGISPDNLHLCRFGFDAAIQSDELIFGGVIEWVG
jgi:hypothetical protein